MDDSEKISKYIILFLSLFIFYQIDEGSKYALEASFLFLFNSDCISHSFASIYKHLNC